MSTKNEQTIESTFQLDEFYLNLREDNSMPQTVNMEEIQNPFPGLRAFKTSEFPLFYGREEQIHRLINKLKNYRFLAITGSAGTGKSSLVRAGLVPHLFGGYLNQGEKNWNLVICKPGKNPIKNLAISFSYVKSHSKENKDIANEYNVIEPLLQSSIYGILEANELLNSNKTAEAKNLLIIVDQFEEIFRFDTNNSGNDNVQHHFVNLLLKASSYTESLVYVIITMRPEFLGDCVKYAGLTEAINEGQYLVPGLNRSQLKEVIQNPIHTAGRKIAPHLVELLINCSLDGQQGENDKLHILQHVLMRTYSSATDSKSQMATNLIDYEDYLAIGEINKCIALHADELFCSLDQSMQVIVKRMFEFIIEKTDDGHLISRPRLINEIMAYTQATAEKIKKIAQIFLKDDCNFLLSSSEELTESTLLEISCRAVLQKWDRLKEWAIEEKESSKKYKWLLASVLNGRELLQGSDLRDTLQWLEQKEPNAAWASRYSGENDFQVVIDYISHSRAVNRENRTSEKGDKSLRKNKIFISYRRADSLDIADRIHERLIRHFRRDTVFYDLDSIPPGEDFIEYIRNKMLECGVLLVIIGNNWLNIREEGAGSIRRLDQPNDNVRAEIEIAFKSQTKIIPVLVGHSKMPKESELPKSIRELSSLNAAEVYSGAMFHMQLQTLIRQIETTIRPANGYLQWFRWLRT